MPGRQDLANNQFFDGGANSSYRIRSATSRSSTSSLSYFKDGWQGSHDFKFGFDRKRDRRNFFQDQPFDIFYRDQDGAVNQIDIYNTPVSPVNDVDYTGGWFSDTWKLTDRADGQLRRPSRVLQGRLARTAGRAERPPGARNWPETPT